MTESSPTTKAPTLVAQVADLAQRVRMVREIAQTAGSYLICTNVDFASLDGFQLSELARKPVVTKNGNEVVVKIDFGLRVQPVASPSETAFEATGSFTVTYDLADGDEPSDDALQSFGDINARFNLTAYWREYVANSLARAGMPALPVPPYNARRAMAELHARSDAMAAAPSAPHASPSPGHAEPPV